MHKARNTSLSLGGQEVLSAGQGESINGYGSRGGDGYSDGGDGKGGGHGSGLDIPGAGGKTGGCNGGNGGGGGGVIVAKLNQVSLTELS